MYLSLEVRLWVCVGVAVGVLSVCWYVSAESGRLKNN